MDVKKVLSFMCVALAWSAGAMAATAACAVDGPQPQEGRRPVEQVSVDPNTGARVTTGRESSGNVVISLVGRDATVRKVLSPDRSVLTLSAGPQQVEIALAGHEVVVSTPEKVWRGSASDQESLSQAAAYLRQSTPGIAAKRLLDHALLRPDTFEGNTLLLSKGLLESFWGERDAIAEYQRWAAARVQASRVKRVMVSDGPGDCWDKYAAEAIRIMNDYIDCGNACGWKGFICMNSCGFIYDIRAEGAFMWYMRCNGGFFVG